MPQSEDTHATAATILVVSFRGKKVKIPLHADTTIGNVKSILLSSVDDSLHMIPSDVKILHKGKVLAAPVGVAQGKEDDDANMRELLLLSSKKKARTTLTTAKATTTMLLPKTIKLIAMGISSSEVKESDQNMEEGMKLASKHVRDDITDAGKINEARRKRLGRDMLQKAAAAQGSKDVGRSSHGFGKIETLPNLPNEKKAREILESLVNDPGILSCMAKHGWNVGCLAELYPEGKVGETDVCVMGLNQNKGQKILLRIRTDDLKGFRKILSVRKVLFHELAHNVHSEHDGKFFQLMRQIEQECNEMDWTKSQGKSVVVRGGSRGGEDASNHEFQTEQLYEGGTYRLGGDKDYNSSEVKCHIPVRDLAARAAMLRLTAEEEEIQRHCGCNHKIEGLDVLIGGEKKNNTADDKKDGEQGKQP